MKRRGILDKKGISPMIATVILIAMVLVIALMVFLWFKNMSKEAITKFNDKNIELVCNDVVFDASYTKNADGTGTVNLVNNGNVPLYGIKLNIYTASGNTPYEFNKETNPGVTPTGLDKGINQGGTFSTILTDVSGATKIVIYPVLLGSSSKGPAKFVCSSNGLVRNIQ